MTGLQENIGFVKKIGNFVSNLLLGETKEVIIRSGVKIEEMEKDINEIKQSFSAITSKIETHGLDIKGLMIHTKYGVSHSPTLPNDLGKQLLEDSKFTEQYPKLRTKLFALMDTMNLRTLYDYEKGAMDALQKLKNDPDIDPIKDYAVNHPDESLELIFLVASWLVRDDYAKTKAPQGQGS